MILITRQKKNCNCPNYGSLSLVIVIVMPFDDVGRRSLIISKLIRYYLTVNNTS